MNIDRRSVQLSRTTNRHEGTKETPINIHGLHAAAARSSRTCVNKQQFHEIHCDSIQNRQIEFGIMPLDRLCGGFMVKNDADDGGDARRIGRPYRCQLVKASEELVEGHHQLLRRALGRQTGETLDVCKQDAADTQRHNCRFDFPASPGSEPLDLARHFWWDSGLPGSPDRKRIRQQEESRRRETAGKHELGLSVSGREVKSAQISRSGLA